MTLPGMGIAPWSLGVVITNTSAPMLGEINRYNATAGQLTVILPALSGLNANARTAMQKYALDSSVNTITFNCAGSDLFDDGTTTFTLRSTGEFKAIQVVLDAGVKRWKIVESVTTISDLPLILGVATTLIPTGYGRYFPDYVEISPGVAFEIGTEAVMEIG